MMFLLTPYYLDSRPERQAELDFCLQKNLQNSLITKVVLFLDNSLNAQQVKKLHHSKIETTFCGGRCTYQDCLDYANTYLQGEIVIIANTDIFFDDSLQDLTAYDLENKFVTLLRWDVVSIEAEFLRTQLNVRMNSQDAWLFRSPLRIFPSDFPLGIPCCDNRILFEAQSVGLRVINPALSIRSYHLHLTNIRNYKTNERLPGPGLLVLPHALEGSNNHKLPTAPKYLYYRDDGNDNFDLLFQEIDKVCAQLPPDFYYSLPTEVRVVQPFFEKLSPTVNLTVIIYTCNSEKTLQITIDSLSCVCDQLLILDNQSTDETRNIAIRNSGEIIEYRDKDSYNTALREAQGRWIFLLEGNEYIDRQTLNFLAKIATWTEEETERTDNYWLPRRWLCPWDFSTYLINFPHSEDIQCRLLRRNGMIYFEDKVAKGYSLKSTFVQDLAVYSCYLPLTSKRTRQLRVLEEMQTTPYTSLAFQFYLPETHPIVLTHWEKEWFESEVHQSLQSLQPVNPSQDTLEPVEIQQALPLIIIDGIFFQLNNTGIGRVWKSLLKEWVSTGFNKHILFLDRMGTAPKIEGIRYLKVPAYQFDQPLASRELNERICREQGASLFISTYYTIPLSTPSIFMAYDMIPENMGWDLRSSTWQLKRQAIGHAHHYLAISENTAQDLFQFYPHIQPRQVTVAHCGIDSSFSPVDSAKILEFRTKFQIFKPFFLLVGKRTLYKNALLFFMAFHELPGNTDYDIVCVGGGSLEDELQSCIGSHKVHVLALVDAELQAAYSDAIALIYPSVYEGFGMPVVEAMACGCPVITCRNSSLEEVAADAVLYVGENNLDEMLEALQKVQKPEIRAALSSSGRQRSQLFSWAKSATVVQNALLKATLPVCLAAKNYVLFPDWQDGSIFEALKQSISNWIQNYDADNSALLIATEGFLAGADTDIDIVLQSILAELFFIQGLEMMGKIELVPPLLPAQWLAIFSCNCQYLSMIPENSAALKDIYTDKL
jgi:glycosyltransferase involved in cell wall biosynthesis